MLANRLLLLVDAGADNLTVQPSLESVSGSVTDDLDSSGSQPAINDLEKPQQFLLDVNGDGVPDLVILPRLGLRTGLRVVDGVSGNQIEIDPVKTALPLLESATTAHLDYDAELELVILGGWDTSTGLVTYKYSNGQMKLLKKDQSTSKDWSGNADWVGTFVDAYITDYDRDGLMEIVEVPWIAVPEDLLPDNPDHQDYGWGRVRYVWKWSDPLGAYELIERTLEGMGGR